MSNTKSPMDGNEQLGPGICVSTAHLRFSFSRGRGPGGQGINKLSTAARLRVSLDDIKGMSPDVRSRLLVLAGSRITGAGELLLSSREHRSQLENRRECLQKLHALIREASRVPPTRRPTRPTRTSQERRLDRKRQQSQKKDRRQRPADDAG